MYRTGILEKGKMNPLIWDKNGNDWLLLLKCPLKYPIISKAGRKLQGCMWQGIILSLESELCVHQSPRVLCHDTQETATEVSVPGANEHQSTVIIDLYLWILNMCKGWQFNCLCCLLVCFFFFPRQSWLDVEYSRFQLSPTRSCCIA